MAEFSHFVSRSLQLSLEKIQHHGQEAIGYLHSFTSNNKDKHLVSCSSLYHQPSSVFDVVQQSLPGGVNVCGLYLVVQDKLDSVEFENICDTKLHQHFESIPGVCQLLLVYNGDTAQLYEYNVQTCGMSPLPHKLSQGDILDSCLLVHLQAVLPIKVEHSKDKDVLSNELCNEIECWREEMMCPTTAFHIPQTDKLLYYSEDAPSSELSCGDLLAATYTDETTRRKKLKSADMSCEVLNVRLLCQKTGDLACQMSSMSSPIVKHNHGSFSHMCVELPVDIVVYVDIACPSDKLTDLLVETICTQLEAACRLIEQGKVSGIDSPVPYHFKPQNLSHIITLLYPQATTDDQLEAERLVLHGIYHLATDRPQLRRLNSHRMPDAELPGGLLINPHCGLAPSGVSDGRLSMVQGFYAYHHYMQDRMDDTGWGCAYRSLQTLVSWFRLQGYTDVPVPNHRQIQQALADIGDKEKSFVGTKQWIGSTEVNYVIDHLLGVTSKILYVSSGAELEGKGRELAMHFDTHGTPIMIGGGVLAHTILGVDFNEVTGEVKFLILDPHYTGAEDTKFIQDKGWCGWKGPDFWDKNAYYNMCMPQRPDTI